LEGTLFLVAVAVCSSRVEDRFEPAAVPFIAGILLGTAALAVSLHLQLKYAVFDATLQAIKFAAVYLGTLASSIVLYRNSPFHPLASFPGPFWARTTQIWFFWQNYKGTPRLALERVHRQYGDFVRIVSRPISTRLVPADLCRWNRRVSERRSICFCDFTLIFLIKAPTSLA
jgi:hypothetical protein